jgi:hypothetical protein
MRPFTGLLVKTDEKPAQVVDRIELIDLAGCRPGARERFSADRVTDDSLLSTPGSWLETVTLCLCRKPSVLRRGLPCRPAWRPG